MHLRNCLIGLLVWLSSNWATNCAQLNPRTQWPEPDPYTQRIKETLFDLKTQISTRSIKFDQHFKDLLSSTKVNLHNLFTDTYGEQYVRNNGIFTKMFENLEEYYANGQVKLTKSMDNFFEELHQKIFQVFNGNRNFTPRYLECATEQLAHLKPFKDAPDRLMREIRHVFVAARTFTQALNRGVDLVKNIISLGHPPQCDVLIKEKLLNHQQSKPCKTYCDQVLTKCFGKANLDLVNNHWRSYTNALNELATKLSTSYDIETIVSSMDVQISEAIMNFQENGTHVSNLIFRACGNTTLFKKIGKRSAPNGSVNLRTTADFRSRLIKSSTVIDEIKAFIASTASFWSSLPSSVCTGNSKGPPVTCFSEPISNQNGDLTYRQNLMTQIARLEDIEDKMSSAMKGVEIDWELVARPSLPRTTTTTEAPDDYDDHTTDDSHDQFDSGSGSTESAIDEEDYPDQSEEKVETSTEDANIEVEQERPPPTAEDIQNSASLTNKPVMLATFINVALIILMRYAMSISP